MTVWRLELTRDFEKDLRKLDKPARQRVAAALDEISELDNPRSRGKGLSGNLAGYWRYRVGDWRVLVEIQDDRLVIVGIGVAHRSSIYNT